MRIAPQHIEGIRGIVREAAGRDARVRLFGSRLDDGRSGGDVDLLVQLQGPVHNPAMLAATIEARVTRLLGGRSVDVVISAPNLSHLPIHDQAERTGVLL